MIGVDSCVFLIFTTRVDKTNGSTLLKLILFEKSRVELEFVFSIFTTRVRKHFGNSGRLGPLLNNKMRLIIKCDKTELKPPATGKGTQACSATHCGLHEKFIFRPCTAEKKLFRASPRRAPRAVAAFRLATIYLPQFLLFKWVVVKYSWGPLPSQVVNTKSSSS